MFLFFSMLLLWLFLTDRLIKRIIPSEKWFNYVITVYFFFLKMPKIWVGRTTPNGEKREDGLTNKEISQIINQAVPEIQVGDEIRFGSFNR